MDFIFLCETVMETQLRTEAEAAAPLGLRGRDCDAACTTLPSVNPSAAAPDTFGFSSAPSNICFSILNSPRLKPPLPRCHLRSSEEVAAAEVISAAYAFYLCSIAPKFGSCTFLFVVSSAPAVDTRGSRRTHVHFSHTSEAHQGK